MLDILDTAGQEEYSSLRDQYYVIWFVLKLQKRVANGFLMVYSINSRSSFEEIQNIHHQVLRVQGKQSFC